MSSAASEAEVLEKLVPGLASEGYEVYLNPGRSVVPEFLGDYSPDAIAIGPPKNLVIEVIRSSSRSNEKLQELNRRLKGRDDWALRVVWVTPVSSGPALKPQARDLVTARMGEVRELIEAGHLAPALLLAWAIFEAIGRSNLPKQFERPQTPGRLVQVLAQEGYLTPSEADLLRSLADKRNKLIHGELQTAIPKRELDRFMKTLNLLSEINNKAA